MNIGGIGSTFSSAPSPHLVPDAILSEIASMKQAIDGLRTEVNSDRVHCAGLLFTLQQFATNWVVKHGISKKMELFVDLVFLLSLSFHTLDTDLEELRFDEHAAKRSSFKGCQERRRSHSCVAME
jgi:hypothetical protein